MKFRSSFVAFAFNYILIAMVLILLFLILKLNLDKNLEFVLLLISIALIFYLVDEPLYRRYYFQYEITDKYLIETSGILTKKQKAIPFKTISEVVVIKNPLGRLLNFGDIKVTAFRGELTLRGIKNPEGISRLIKEKMTKENT